MPIMAISESYEHNESTLKRYLSAVWFNSALYSEKQNM